MAKGPKTKPKRSKFRAAKGDLAPLTFDKRKSRIDKNEADAIWGNDDEDEFYRQKDTIGLDEPGRVPSRDDLDDLSEDEEVFALDLPSDEGISSDVDGMQEEDDHEEEEEDGDHLGVEGFTKDRKKDADVVRGRFTKAVGSTDQHSDSSEEGEDEDEGGVEEEEEGTWHPSAYHATRRTPGELDSEDEDEEAIQLELEEARRLQKRARASLAPDDFGYTDEQGVVPVQRETFNLVEEEELEETGTTSLGEEAAIALLLKENPETLALVDDFSLSAERLKDVEAKLHEVRSMEEAHPSLPLLELEYQALVTYLTNQAFYFSLLLTRSPSPTLVEKVLTRLASVRQALATMEELDLTSAEVGSDDDDDDDDKQSGGRLASDVWDAVEGEIDEDNGENDDDDELNELMLEMQEANSLKSLNETIASKKRSLIKSSVDAREKVSVPGTVLRKKRALSATADDIDENRRVKMRTKQGKSKAGEPIDVLSLVPELAPLSSKTLKVQLDNGGSESHRRSRLEADDNEDDLIESTSLSKSDLEDKASKRHTLRFHVSQVHQKAQRRASARLLAASGDEDLPRRSKERSRREVLKRQDHGHVEGRTELDDVGWDDRDQEARADVVGDDGYYELVQKELKESKDRKKEEYDRLRAKERDELETLSAQSAAGPREATRQILSNKGLTPKRAKINRNPRVKKRKQYDKAVKKVASMKPVFKGDRAREGRDGGYVGEKSGISGRVVKSVRLG